MNRNFAGNHATSGGGSDPKLGSVELRHAQQPELLPVKEVSALTGLGISTIWRGVARGRFPAPIKVCGSTRWRRSDIEALFTAGAA